MEALELFLGSLSTQVNRSFESNQTLDQDCHRELHFLRGSFINVILNYIRNHHGFEHVIKSGVLLTRKYLTFYVRNLSKPEMLEGDVEVRGFDPYNLAHYRLSDLMALWDQDVEQDFFE
jgi:hypothetical protein